MRLQWKNCVVRKISNFLHASNAARVNHPLVLLLFWTSIISNKKMKMRTWYFVKFTERKLKRRWQFVAIDRNVVIFSQDVHFVTVHVALIKLFKVVLKLVAETFWNRLFGFGFDHWPCHEYKIIFYWTRRYSCYDFKVIAQHKKCNSQALR